MLVRQALEQVRRFSTRVMSAVERRRELIRELRFEERQAQARRMEREQSRAMSRSRPTECDLPF